MSGVPESRHEGPAPGLRASAEKILWALAALILSSALLVTGLLGFQTRTVTVQETELRPVHQTREKEIEVEIDGKKRTLRVPQEEVKLVKEVTSKEVQVVHSPEQRTVLWIMIGVAVIALLYSLVVVGAFALHLLGGKPVPETLEKHLERVVATLFGLLVGFLGGGVAKASPPVPKLEATARLGALVEEMLPCAEGAEGVPVGCFLHAGVPVREASGNSRS